jgi:hypothetical protein
MGLPKQKDDGNLDGRDRHVIKKALAIAIMTIDRQPGKFKALSDQDDMKDLLDRLIKDDGEMAMYMDDALTAVTGVPPAMRRK